MSKADDLILAHCNAWNEFYHFVLFESTGKTHWTQKEILIKMGDLLVDCIHKLEPLKEER